MDKRLEETLARLIEKLDTLDGEVKAIKTVTTRVLDKDQAYLAKWLGENPHTSFDEGLTIDEMIEHTKLIDSAKVDKGAALRRVYSIDVGAMAPDDAMAHIDRIRDEIHQRRIPNRDLSGLGDPASTTLHFKRDESPLTEEELRQKYVDECKNWFNIIANADFDADIEQERQENDWLKYGRDHYDAFVTQVKKLNSLDLHDQLIAIIKNTTDQDTLRFFADNKNNIQDLLRAITVKLHEIVTRTLICHDVFMHNLAHDGFKKESDTSVSPNEYFTDILKRMEAVSPQPATPYVGELITDVYKDDKGDVKAFRTSLV